VAPAVNGILAVVDPVAVAVPTVGACGTVVAVTAEEAALALLAPAAPVAVTVYVYCVEDCNPVTISGLEAPVAVSDPGLDVTVKEVTGRPVVAAKKATDCRPLLKARPEGVSVATTEVGASGGTIETASQALDLFTKPFLKLWLDILNSGIVYYAISTPLI
jgi:hypothetical protein